MNPLRDGGGGKEDPLTTRVIGRPYIRRRCHITLHTIPYAVVEAAAFMVVSFRRCCLWSIDILVEETVRGTQRRTKNSLEQLFP